MKTIGKILIAVVLFSVIVLMLMQGEGWSFEQAAGFVIFLVIISAIVGFVRGVYHGIYG